ncbi:hypothetical protein NC651_018901 [Populus alba x Populus x berolinensis]|nr:hypothetical protein NC651_018901 [Populus alba x Populus x berolinensis]
MRRGQKCVFFPLLAIALCLCMANVDAGITLQPPVKLKWHYYRQHTTCTYAEEFVRHQVELFWKADRSITAKLLRLLYSDCFVTAGGPSYPVFTGRRDGVSSKAATVDLPSPSISGEEALAYFKSRGLDVLDLGTLLGAHSMGRTHCRYILDRLYNFNNTGRPDPSMNKAFADQMRKQCPQRTKKGQSDPLVFLNPESSSKYTLTESFYKRVLSYQSVLGVDQQLLFSNDTLQITQEFAGGFEYLRRSLALSMSRMGNINVLTGNAGEIRRNCRYINDGKT